MARHERTLAAVFASPTPTNLKWKDVEALLIAKSARKIEGDGSRVRFELGGVRLSLHRPHPSPELKRYAVRAVRDFLIEAGVTP